MVRHLLPSQSESTPLPSVNFRPPSPPAVAPPRLLVGSLVGCLGVGLGVGWLGCVGWFSGSVVRWGVLGVGSGSVFGGWVVFSCFLFIFSG